MKNNFIYFLAILSLLLLPISCEQNDLFEFSEKPIPGDFSVSVSGIDYPYGSVYDFGSTFMGTTSPLATFTIKNNKNKEVSLIGPPYVAKNGSNSSNFTINDAASSTITPGGSTTFSAYFTPGGTGIHSTSISFKSASPDDYYFTLYLKATGANVTVDITAPTPGTAISYSAVTQSTMFVTWGQATDNITPPLNLQYKLVKAINFNLLDTVALADAITTPPDLVMDWNNSVTAPANSLILNTTYYFNVLVKDSAGNISQYGYTSQTTLP